MDKRVDLLMIEYKFSARSISDKKIIFIDYSLLMTKPEKIVNYLRKQLKVKKVKVKKGEKNMVDNYLGSICFLVRKVKRMDSIRLR